MNRYAALLRAVNVGGTSKLPMADLRALCEAIGCTDVRTYIASGNVVLSTAMSRDEVRSQLEERLEAVMGKRVGVCVRTAPEMQAVLERNPFPEARPNQVLVTFLNQPPPANALEAVSHQAENESIVLGTCEIYVHYGSGMGRSKLRIPAAKSGTARNLNTVTKLVAMLQEG